MKSTLTQLGAVAAYLAFCLCASGVQAQEDTDNSLLSKKRLPSHIEESDESTESLRKGKASWHFIVEVSSAEKEFSMMGTRVVITGKVVKIIDSPYDVKLPIGSPLTFRIYCGNPHPDNPVEPCRPYTTAEHIEIWGKFGTEGGQVSPNSLQILVSEPTE